MTQANRQLVEQFLDTINRQCRVREAFENYVSDEYIQHNPGLTNGREAAIGLIQGMVATPGFRGSVKRMVAEGDLVAVHLHIEFGGEVPDLAVMDMFRLEHGKIVEHWDVIQEARKATASGNSMF